MARSRQGKTNWVQLAGGLMLATAFAAGVIFLVSGALRDVANSVGRFGFYSFRPIHVTLLDATRLSDAVKFAAIAPDRQESLDFLSEANDYAYIRFVSEDRSKLIADVPAYQDISERMQAMIQVVDIVIKEGLPMDVAKLRRVSGHISDLLTQMGEIYYAHGNQINADVALADRRLEQLWLEVTGLLVVSYLLALGAVVLLVKRHETAVAMKYQATHDTLTGLRNRAWLTRNNEKLFDLAHLAGRPLMLFLIDIDRFKEINDTYGHQMGDALLARVAGMLKEFEAEDEVVAVRLGGDELALLAIAGDEQAAEDLRSRVGQTLNCNLEIGSQPIRLGTSIGVALYPQHGGEIEALTHSADIALYRAKQEGRARTVLFDPEIMGGPDEKGKLQARARDAITNGEFELYWQPIFNLHDGSLSGAEAFLRWNDRRSGRILMPGEFLPLAAQTDLILDIDRMVLVRASAAAARWEAELRGDFVISVNISAKHLQSENFPDYVASVARRAGLSPRHLEIDISEDVFVADREMAFLTVRRLRDHGFRVALDDFGKGTADLQYLAELDIDRLKIDGAFIGDIERSEKKQALVSAMISAARASKAAIVAENVETQAQLTFLIERGCDFAQGYLLAEPTDSATFRTYLQRNVGKIGRAPERDRGRAA